MKKRYIIIGIIIGIIIIGGIIAMIINNSKKEIIISPEIIQFKRETIEYVIAHEFCHLKYKTHCKSFNDIMEEKFENYIKIESELSGYKF